MAHALQIDTLKLAEDLEAASGDPRRTAKVIGETIGTIDISELATKADIAEVRTEIVALDGKIDKVATALDGKIDKVATALDGKIDKVDGKIDKVAAELKADLLKWMFGALGVQTGIILAVVKLL